MWRRWSLPGVVLSQHLPFLICCLVAGAGCQRNLPPSVTLEASSDRVVAGEPAKFLARVRDIEREEVSVRFDWGDGDTSAWSEFRGQYGDFISDHAWADSGHFIVKAQARDESGHESEWLGGVRLIVLDSSIIKWVAQVGSAGVTCPAVAPDGTVFLVAGYDIVAVNPDGSGVRQIGPSSNGLGSVAIAEDGTVYAADHYCLRAFNPDGSLKWSDSLGAWDLHSPAIGPDGTVYACDYDTAVAVNPDGTVKWRTGLDGRIRGSPVIGRDGTICFATHSTDAVCAVGPDGARRWTAYVGFVEWLSVGADGGYVATGNEVTWLAPDGRLVWQTSGFGNADGPAIIRANGDMLVSLYYGLVVLHPDRTWESVLGEWQPGLAAAVDGAGDVYFGSTDREGSSYPYRNATICLDSSLARKWSIEDEGEVRSAPGVAPDGTIYVVTSRGCLYALRGKALGADAPWPKFGHDSRNTNCAATR